MYGGLPSMYIYWHGLSLRASDLSTSSTFVNISSHHTHTHALRPSPSATTYQVSARFCDSLISLLLPLVVVAAKDDEGLSFL